MVEGQPPGVQQRAVDDRDRPLAPGRRGPRRAPPTAVEGVADDRVAEVGQVDPDLVGPAGPREDRQQRRPARTADAPGSRSRPRAGGRCAARCACGRSGRGRSAGRSVPPRRRTSPQTSVRYSFSTRWPLNWAVSERWARSFLATRMTPEVPLSSRWTIPGRSSPPMPERSRRPPEEGVDQRAGRRGRERGGPPCRPACRSPGCRRPRRAPQREILGRGPRPARRRDDDQELVPGRDRLARLGRPPLAGHLPLPNQALDGRPREVGAKARQRPVGAAARLGRTDDDPPRGRMGRESFPSRDCNTRLAPRPAGSGASTGESPAK